MDSKNTDSNELGDMFAPYKSVMKWAIGIGVVCFIADRFLLLKTSLDLEQAIFYVFYFTLIGALYKRLRWWPLKDFNFLQIFLWAVIAIIVRGLLLKVFAAT